ncbi:hypothetical protein OS493_001411 [Desmophyllum pertusum]|uniref:Uncharacterized protein n=1 Tax=Desmophyllum pertusum TaxID=174260 RepID=A0A9W9ZGY3_9CNID|nr:hypothetical protein OS493_001411 [Desmophyllum pertusum]
MADDRGRKRKGEKSDEFFHIRAKGQFLKVPKGQECDEKEVRGKKTRKIPSRRDQRWQARVQKKERKVAFFSKKKEQTQRINPDEKTHPRDYTRRINPGSKYVKHCFEQKATEDKQCFTKELAGDNLALIEKKRRKRTRTKVPKSQQILKQKLLADNSKEEKEIKKLEKLLKLGSKGKVPSSKFKTEGLDYLLEVCEPQMIENSKGYCGDNSVESESRPKLFSKSVSKAWQIKAEEHDMDVDGNDEQSENELKDSNDSNDGDEKDESDNDIGFNEEDGDNDDVDDDDDDDDDDDVDDDDDDVDDDDDDDDDDDVRGDNKLVEENKSNWKVTKVCSTSFEKAKII